MPVMHPDKIMGFAFDRTDIPTDAQVLTFSSAKNQWDAQAGGGSAGYTVVKKTADESVTSSITLQDDDELKFSADANSVYWVRVKGIAFSASQTPDFKNTWSVPSGATGVHIFRLLSGQDLVTLGTSVMTALTDTIDGDFIEPTAIITIGSTAGEVTLSWAQNTSDATATTVKKGTILEFVKVA